MFVNKNKTKEPGNIIVIKLITGEEVMGEIESIADNLYHLKNPFRLQFTDKGVGLMPYSFIMDETSPVSFRKEQVVSEFIPSTESANDYIRASSNIEIAQESPSKNK